MAKMISGGCFAPPITDEKLVQYEEIANQSRPEIKDAMLQCLVCVRKWWDLPESKGLNEPHPSGKGFIVALDPEIEKALYDHIPWSHELDGIQKLFDSIPANERALRNAAFHLLWYVRELNNDHEPITTDKL